jgi:hypothetical protein
LAALAICKLSATLFDSFIFQKDGIRAGCFHRTSKQEIENFYPRDYARPLKAKATNLEG